MQVWPRIPADVVEWFRAIFKEANRRVCERLTNVPNIREPSLDDGLIEALIPEIAPKLLPSGAIVRMDTHNIGGLRRLGRLHWDFPFLRPWETADIAILVFVYRDKNLIAKKIGLLQSKRLYPDNGDVEDEDEIGFMQGMNAFLRREGTQAIAALHRTYNFEEKCVYGALHAGSDQIRAIDSSNRSLGNAVYYLFYNPHLMPFSVSYPVAQRVHVDSISVGCRVADASLVHGSLSDLREGHSPTFELVQEATVGSNWPLEVWAADLLLTCQVGQQFDDSRDSEVIYLLLERRSGPIGAALAVSVILPDE